MNLEGLEVNTQDEVHVIVNYDNLRLAPDLFDAYTEAASKLSEAYYADVSRYTTSSFLRLKLGDALANRGVAPHIYESREEALRRLRA